MSSLRKPTIRTAVDFIHSLRLDEIPQGALGAARRSLADTIAVGAAGLRTANSRIVRDFAAEHHATTGRGARTLFDGRRLAPAGAAMAGAATIDSFDAHDGQRETKGHAGVVVLPALLAFADEISRGDGREFLTRFVLGYEIAVRAGIALHATVSDYHTSGAWNALGAAAIGARAMHLSGDETRHALGIAEYYGPRSQMMRVIDSPSMLKDGATLGAYAGVSAAFLAEAGFTGAPAITVEAPEVASIWGDLGQRWRMEEQYLKPYPVCRWAQPAIRAALSLQDEIAGRAIERLRVVTFHEATRLAASAPANTEEAQYALPFPVAAALVHGRVGAEEIDGEGLRNPEVLALAKTVELVEEAAYNARFPAERLAHVEVTLADGAVLASRTLAAHGDPENPLSEGELSEKVRLFAEPILGSARAGRILEACEALPEDAAYRALIEDVLSPA
ncbi:MAG: MmgE/PrpD family protein [Rhodovibrionaceae bacterium]|nr:MmgE/PrpD family protein [Rhodovibrionaceae bacterium]